MPSPVFISHSSRDGKIATALCEALERRGAPCWISSRDVGPGENFQEAIVRALRRSSLMVLVFSNNANNSNEIKKEIAIASQQKLVVIPVRVEDVAPSDAFAYELAIRQWIDLFSDWDRSLDRLIAQITAVQTDQSGGAMEGRGVVPPAPMPVKRSLRPLVAATFGLMAVGGAVYGVRDQLFSPAKKDASTVTTNALVAQVPQTSAAPQLAPKPAEPASAKTVTASPADQPKSVSAAAAIGQQASANPRPNAPAAPPPQTPSADAVARQPALQAAANSEAAAQTASAPSAVQTDVATLQTPVVQGADAQAATALPPVRNDVIEASAPSRLAIAAEPPPLDRIGQGGQVFQECDKCPQMVVVPSGSSLLGSPANEAGRQSHEATPTEVSFATPFAVGRFDVSFEQWDACVAEGGCNNWRPGDYGWGRGRQPVIFVSWGDAQAYVAWLSQKTGKPYRLLTEAEWEYAARGCRAARCVSSPFWFQTGIKPELANYDSRYSYGGSPKAQAARKTVAVDNGVANPFGLVHIIGNVRKWTADCWRPTPSSAGVDIGARNAAECRDHAVRGGSWADEPKDLRAGARGWAETNERVAQIGFRVARSLTP